MLFEGIHGVAFGLFNKYFFRPNFIPVLYHHHINPGLKIYGNGNHAGYSKIPKG